MVVHVQGCNKADVYHFTLLLSLAGSKFGSYTLHRNTIHGTGGLEAVTDNSKAIIIALYCENYI
jgi:hypothetical protein